MGLTGGGPSPDRRRRPVLSTLLPAWSLRGANQLIEPDVLRLRRIERSLVVRRDLRPMPPS